MSEFKPWPKTPRLFREVTITEKLDGTNAAIIISEDGTEVAAQSRSRIITPEDDHFGFAAWVYANAGALVDTLGPGHHYGEWWGSGIQRGYGLPKGDRRFSLFNTKRWDAVNTAAVDGLEVVPILYQGPFSTEKVHGAVHHLRSFGSMASLGFMRPEGVVVYHSASNQVFKVTLEKDDEPKGRAA